MDSSLARSVDQNVLTPVWLLCPKARIPGFFQLSHVLGFCSMRTPALAGIHDTDQLLRDSCWPYLLSAFIGTQCAAAEGDGLDGNSILALLHCLSARLRLTDIATS